MEEEGFLEEEDIPDAWKDTSKDNEIEKCSPCCERMTRKAMCLEFGVYVEDKWESRMDMEEPISDYAKMTTKQPTKLLYLSQTI